MPNHTETKSVSTERPAPAKTKSQRLKSTKAASVRKLLAREKGATMKEMEKATGWQPHSVRAFLSGLRKEGATLVREQRGNEQIAYRMADEPKQAEAS